MRPSFTTLTLSVLALAGLLASACGDGENGRAGRRAEAAELVRSDASRAPADAAAGLAAADAVEAFAADLYAVLSREDGNLVFSPYSAAVALAMTRAGAADETAEQMDRVLHAELAGAASADALHAGFNALEQALADRPGEYEQGDSSVELELATANQLWGQQGFEFEQEFLDLLAAEYGAGMRLVDYVSAREEARAAINDWVAERTRDRIPELIPEGVLTELTRLVLTNATYLKAPWLRPFDGGTAAGAFHRIDGSEVQAQLMRLGALLRYARGDGFQAVELPYVGDQLSMVVVVPDAGEFAAFESAFDAARLRAVIDALAAGPQVELAFPRFEFRSQSALRPALSELGMPIAFEAGSADFSGMNRDLGRELYIQEVLHEAFIAVDEEGTEAAAATAIVVGVTSAPAETVQLTVDRPFIFLIRDAETGAILFMGRVLDPTG